MLGVVSLNGGRLAACLATNANARNLEEARLRQVKIRGGRGPGSTIEDMNIRALFAAALVAAALVAQSRDRRPNYSGGVLGPDQACYDVRRYELSVDVDPAAETIVGSLTMRAEALTECRVFAMDLDDCFKVDAVDLDGLDVPYAFRDGRIVMRPVSPLAAGVRFDVRVRYRGAPRAAKSSLEDGITWSKTKAGDPWIATRCREHGADLWWPCKDHPSDKPDGFDLRCTVPAGLVCASNGSLQGTPVTAAGRTTFHWRTTSPISNHCVAMNIAPYVLLTDTFTCVDGSRTPVAFYVLPGSERKAKRCMRAFLDHVAVFERVLGPYPFRSEKYGLAETPHTGGPNQTILGYGNGFRDEQYDQRHNHELAHEWWGNLVTCKGWQDAWLHEAFATYMQPLYREIRFGRRAYEAEIHRHRTVNKAPLAPRRELSTQEIDLDGNDIAYKGSLVLHTLRYVLGDESFLEALRRFAYPTPAARRRVDGGQVRFVDTEDFVRLVNQVAGEDLGWFFEVYVRRAALPCLVYAVVDGKLELEWEVPDGLPFPLSVPVSVGGVEVRARMDAGKGSIDVSTADFDIDPGRRLLMARPRKRR